MGWWIRTSTGRTQTHVQAHTPILVGFTWASGKALCFAMKNEILCGPRQFVASEMQATALSAERRFLHLQEN